MAADEQDEAQLAKLYISSLVVATKDPLLVVDGTRPIKAHWKQAAADFERGVAARKKVGDHLAQSQAYVYLLRHVEMVLMNLPKHPQYSKADKECMESKRAVKLLDILEKIKPQLIDSYLKRAATDPAGAVHAPTSVFPRLGEVPVPGAIHIPAGPARPAPEPELEPEPELTPACSEQRPPKTIKVYGDGHCLYRSVACHLNPDIARLPRNEFGIILRPDERPIEEAAAISLRNRVASYMESHWDEFPTVLEEERATRLRGIRGREWGGEEEIAVLAGVLGVTMVVHDVSRGHKLEYVPEKKPATSTVHLRYTRNEEAALVSGDLEAGGHYDLFTW